jgi:hypothetical protein
MSMLWWKRVGCGVIQAGDVCCLCDGGGGVCKTVNAGLALAGMCRAALGSLSVANSDRATSKVSSPSKDDLSVESALKMIDGTLTEEGFTERSSCRQPWASAAKAK